MIKHGSITHRVCEAVLTHPITRFSSTEIWEVLHQDYPEIKRATVSALLTSKRSSVAPLIGGISEEKPREFTRAHDAEMPILSPLKPTVKHGRTKTKIAEAVTKSKSSSQDGFSSSITMKPQPIPETVTDSQIGMSIIHYIDQLKDKIKCLASAYANTKTGSADKIRLLNQEVARKEDTIKKLKEELILVREKNRVSSRTFNMDEVARFKT